MIPGRSYLYILFQIIPPLITGVFIFIALLLMLQALRLTEFLLIHGVGTSVLAQLMFYLAISFLPIIIPMSLMLAILMTYSRLSSENEILALKAIGYGPKTLLAPAFTLGILMTITSLYTSFELGPWGKKKFEELFADIHRQKPSITLREGTFAEGFFNLVLFAQAVDSEEGVLSGVFIYDDREAQAPLAIVAKKGFLNKGTLKDQHLAYLQLIDGSVHRIQQGRHTVLSFETYEVILSDPFGTARERQPPASLNYQELTERIEKAKGDRKIRLQIEWHKRVTIALACTLFSILGVALGSNPHRRQTRATGAILALVIIVSYWAIFILTESLALNGQIPVLLAIWSPVALFSIIAGWSFRRL